MPDPQTRFTFRLAARCRRARAGVFSTTHGDLLTPVFAPVGTQGTVKALTPAQLEELGASLVLANTYHLYLRPGEKLVAELGGLHRFMQWPGPMLTDSGGFQVFSLSAMRNVDDDGVTFKSHIDGSKHRFTPERSIQIQEDLGADIIMAFDHLAAPDDRAEIETALQRTHAWAVRCKSAHNRQDQALFGIVQGGIFPDLRAESAEYLTSLDFPGYAVGGLSVGETKDDMNRALEVVDPLLPEDKPRYLMGVGAPEDLVNGVMRGIDIFDCVLPTRLARHQSAMTRTGRLNLMNAAYAADPAPIEDGCDCYTCRNFSRAYLRHLILAKEILASTLVSIHNVRMLVRLMEDIRRSILAGTFDQFARDFFLNRESPPTLASTEPA